MSQHTPHHPHEAATGTGATTGTDPTPTHLNQTDATQTDLVAGDPPVPLTVWRTAHTPADTGHGINARLATRLVAAYSRPGEAVVDLTDEHALTNACTAGARRHHPAWFTDAVSLIIGPTTPPRPVQAPAPTDTDEEDDLPDLGAWFGDDLTDPDLPPYGGPTDGPSDDGSLRRETSLVVARWPLDTTDAANRVRLAWLLAACARLLRPGGCLILVVATPSATATTPEDYSQVVAAAAGAGLGYLQHIVAVTTEVNDDGDAFVYHATDEELLTLAATTGEPWQVAHLRVHADLLVFSQPQTPQPHRPGRGGGRRD